LSILENRLYFAIIFFGLFLVIFGFLHLLSIPFVSYSNNIILVTLHSFCFTLIILDGFKLSDDKILRNLQICVFILFLLIAAHSFYSTFDVSVHVVLNVNPDDTKKALEIAKEVADKTEVSLSGTINIDKDAASEIVKGLAKIPSQYGSAVVGGAAMAAVGKLLKGSSTIPMVGKIGITLASGAGMLAVQTGLRHIESSGAEAAAIAAAKASLAETTRMRTEALLRKSEADKIALEKNIGSNVKNSFLGDTGDVDWSSLEYILGSLYILNTVIINIFIIITLHCIIRFICQDRPKLLFLDKIFSEKSVVYKGYIYKIIELNKKAGNLYVLLSFGLIFFFLVVSQYMTLSLLVDIDNYVEIYNYFHKKT